MRIKLEWDKLFSVPEVAIICDVSEATVRSWIKNGKISRAHTISNQGAIAVRGNELWSLLRDNPSFNRIENTVDIPDDVKIRYLLAAKAKCMREISAAETALRKEMTQLNEILRELFEEEES